MKAQTSLDPNQLINEYRVAELLNVSASSVRQWRFSRRGPKFVKIGASVRYRLDDVRRFIASLPTGGGIARKRK